MISLTAGHPNEYLGSDAVVESGHPEVVGLATRLRLEHHGDEAFGLAAFEWVRDEAAHALDVRDSRVTLTASEVLRERVGLCYAKSHLLAALLRAEGIPAGLCYQRLRRGDGFSLHGLVAVRLRGGWHRLDPRGNKLGVGARFSLEEECLAFAIDKESGEIDYPTVYVSPVPDVVRALSEADDTLTLCDRGGLPAELVEVGHQGTDGPHRSAIPQV